jgi:hypothetical protein
MTSRTAPSRLAEDDLADAEEAEYTATMPASQFVQASAPPGIVSSVTEAVEIRRHPGPPGRTFW